MMKENNYDVFDLGVDEKVRKYHDALHLYTCIFVGMSALLKRTMMSLKCFNGTIKTYKFLTC